MRFPFFRNRDSVKNGILISIRRTGDGFHPGLFTLLKLAKFGLILVVSICLSILSCIDISYLFHTLFFVSHIFSTNPVPLHFFIIVCSSGGLQVGWTIQRIIVRWFASSPMGIII